MVGFFGFPFAGKEGCNKCNACACGAGACGASACGCDDGCGCKKARAPWWGNWFNKGCDNGCGCDKGCGNKLGNLFDWFN